jgi:carboxymethylenebutenolidase
MKRTVLTLAAIALGISSLNAQDWAKARLEKSPRHQEWVTVKSGDREVKCFIT